MGKGKGWLPLLSIVVLASVVMLFSLNAGATSTSASPQATPDLTGVYFADKYASRGAIWRYHPETHTVSMVYQRPSGRLTNFVLEYFPNKIYFIYNDQPYIYEVTRFLGRWQSPQIIYTHSTYVRDLAVGPGGYLYFSEASGSRGDGKIYRLVGNTPSLYYTVRLSEIGGFWTGDFAFDEKGTLYLATGNQTSAAIYKVVNGHPTFIYRATHPVVGIFVRAGIAYYTDAAKRIYYLYLLRTPPEEHLLHTFSTASHLSDVYVLGKIHLPTPTPTPRPTATPTPTQTPTPTPSPTPSPTPTQTPTPGPLPDLRVSDIWWENDHIWFQVMNVGEGEAVAGHPAIVYIDGMGSTETYVNETLGPGERWNGFFGTAWSCTPPSDVIRVCADYMEYVPESNEENNCREEIWQCDTTPPTITGGPTVEEVTSTGAVIVWTTDEESTSVVRYGTQAGVYSQEVRVDQLVRAHRVQVRDLNPSTVYHFVVQSTDASGNTVESEAGFFETAPAPDNEPPTLHLTMPGVITQTYLLQPDVKDNQGIDRVVFEVDGRRVHTAYSEPYTYMLNPGDFSPGTHRITVITWDLAGHRRDRSHVVEMIPLAPDTTAPEVTIHAPQANTSWRCTVSLNVEAVDPPALHQERAGIRSISVYLDTTEPEGLLRFWLVRQDPLPYTYTFTPDLNVESLRGQHTLIVQVSDGAGNVGQASVPITLESCATRAGEVTVTRENLQSQGTAITFDLVITNEGPSTVYNVEVWDFSYGFQVASTDPATAVMYWNEIPLGLRVYYDQTRASQAIAHINTLSPGQSRRFSFIAVPILFANPAIPPDNYIIGESTWVRFQTTPDGMGSQVVYSTAAQPAQGPSVSDLFAAADYLIITHPGRLFQENPVHHINVHYLLQKAARLAALRGGVLGYLEGNVSEIYIRSLIRPRGPWAQALNARFRQTLGGYVLILGESEIVPAWDLTTNDVPLSDQPYADTLGGDSAPELVVGRIIGNTAEDLETALDTALDLAEGRGYTHQGGLVTSGREDSWEGFIPSAMAIEQALAPKVSPRIGATSIHWMWHVYKEQMSTGFALPFDVRDAFALADVDGDDRAEVVVVRETGLYAYKHEDLGGTQSSPSYTNTACNNRFDRPALMAAGHVRTDAREDVVLLYRGLSAIIVCSPLETTRHLYSLGFVVPEDATLAVGDLIPGGNEEIVIFTRQENARVGHMYVFQIGRSELILVGERALPYDRTYGVAIGDVLSSYPGDEIVMGTPYGGRISVYRFFPWGEVATFEGEVYFIAGAGLVVGNVDDDDPVEIVVLHYNTGHAKKRLFVFEPDTHPDTAQHNMYIRDLPLGRVRLSVADEVGDMLSIGDLDGDGRDEIGLARPQSHRFYSLDAGYPHTWKPRMLATIQRLWPWIDVLFMRGHGNSAFLSPFSRDEIAQFGWGDKHPFVWGLSCLTGNYEGANDQGFAEEFLKQGAGAYIGATRTTGTYHNSNGGRLFVEGWDLNEPVGKAHARFERSRAAAGWRAWVQTYNFYGDPRMGVRGFLDRQSDRARPQEASPPETLTVKVPMYQVTQVDGYDQVSIPGGEHLLEAWKPQVPIYVYRVPLPAGYRVQRVTLVEKTSLHVVDHVELPRTLPYTDTLTLDMHATSTADTDDTLYPGQDFTWTVVENPDGTSTLYLRLYPFQYNAQAARAYFYQQFRFRLEYSHSNVHITQVTPSCQRCPLGEPVQVDVSLENGGESQDVTVEVLIKDPVTGERLTGLMLRTLHDFAGQASYRLTWDPTDMPPRLYVVDAWVRNTQGHVLAHATASLMLGVREAALRHLRATPRYFTPGESVNLSLDVYNAGDVPLDGLLRIRILDDSGTVVQAFRDEITDLAPGHSRPISHTWDTAGVASGEYVVQAVFHFDSRATPFVVLSIGTLEYMPRRYLPMLMR